MKSIKTLALVTGLLAISGVSQAQFSSTWTAVSDYDFRGVSQSGKSPAIQGSADYAFGDSGFSVGAWASNVDWEPAEDEIELDLYANYVGKINDTWSWTAGATWYDYPDGDDLDGYAEAYVGFNAGREFRTEDITQAFGRQVPLSVSQREIVQALRSWLREGRAQSASFQEAREAEEQFVSLPLDLGPAGNGK